MKKFLLFVLLLFLATTGYRAQAQGRIIEFSHPKMKVFLPPSGLANGKALVACPGGGYTHLAVNHEGYHWAPFYNNLGLVYAVLEYTLPNGDRNLPMKDVEAAFQLLTDSASVWSIQPDKIGIMGSSAGGHLASTMSTHPTDACKPAFQILFYPVISLDPQLTHSGSRNGFLGNQPSEELVKRYSNELQVTADTPRAFLVLAADDRSVKPMNSLNYFNALQQAGVPVSMFIYPNGGHGFGFRDTFKYHEPMLNELSIWLKSF